MDTLHRRPGPWLPVSCRAVMVVGLVLAAGCGDGTPGEDASTRVDSLRTGEADAMGDSVPGPRVFVPRGVTGELALAEGRARFRPCGESRWRTLLPRDSVVDRELRTLPGQLETGARPVVAHLVLSSAAATEDRIAEIRSAFPESAGCPEALPDTEFQARGNEPFWTIDVDGAQARVRTPERPDGELWVDGAWDETDDGWRFRAVREGGPSGGADTAGTLTLQVVEERCRDSMSGAWYPFSARARVGTVEWSGCALEGRQIPQA